jgi:hypothetical protein
LLSFLRDRNRVATIFSASGPEILMMPTPPIPGGVATAAIVAVFMIW